MTRAAGARHVALRVLRRVDADGAYANLVLPAELDRAGLEQQDARFATDLAYGTLRMRGTIDAALEPLTSRRPDPLVRDVLRLGAWQLLFGGVAPHAAVSETVALAPVHARGFVNAVLRRLAAEGFVPPDAGTARSLEVRHSHPRWIVDLWIRELGEAHTDRLCAAGNEVPAIGLRAYRPRDEVVARLRSSGLDAAAGRYSPSSVVVSGGGRPDSWPGFPEGDFAVQDESSSLVADAVPRGDVADLCAGPGGKAWAIAAAGSRCVAVEANADRVRLIARGAARLGVRLVALQGDGRRPPVRPGLDAVLVDAPCSGLGVLRRRPDARWRVVPADVDACAAVQRQLVEAAMELLGPRGTLVYAVCTVTRAETTDVVESVLDRGVAELVEVHPDIPRAEGLDGPCLQLLPHVHGTDGMFIASLRRRS